MNDKVNKVNKVGKLLVIGYYNKDNLGDDCYQLVMGSFFEDFSLVFVNSSHLEKINLEEFNGIIVGGGDIINDYFNNHIKLPLSKFKGPKIAFSIGIPFPSLIKTGYLGHFDHIFTRNYEDVRDIQKLLGSHKAHYIPDIALSFNTTKKKIKNTRKRCGVFLVGNLMDFPKIVEDISHTIKYICSTHNIIFYSFNPSEDIKIAKKVKEIIGEQYYTRLEIKYCRYTPQEMIDEMVGLDFAVCMRYHSHIFCTVAGLPFISISSTRKTRSFMRQAGLKKYQYEIELNGNCTPIGSNRTDMIKTYNKAIREIEKIKYQLTEFLTQSKFLLATQQPSNLFKIYGCDIRKGIESFICKTGDCENAARLLSNYIIGYPDSPYVWGMYQKFQSADKNLYSVIQESAQYLLYQAATVGSGLLSYISEKKTIPLFVDINEYQLYKTVHRGGWYIACENLSNLNSKTNDNIPNGIICDMYIDRTFHWAKSYMAYQGIIPYTSPWCGFIHHTEETTYSQYNTKNLLGITEFIQSLHTCMALFVLSNPLKDYLSHELSFKGLAPHIKIIKLDHPVVSPSIKFTMSKFKQNKTPRLINVGAWLRNTFTIYSLDNTNSIKKSLLLASDMSNCLPPNDFNISSSKDLKIRKTDLDIRRTDLEVHRTPCRPETNNNKWIAMLEIWLSEKGYQPEMLVGTTLYIKGDQEEAKKIDKIVKDMISTVEIIENQDNNNYDRLLSNNIIFLDLIDAAAVNTIIECIVRNTPVLVNKIKGTVALLGENYPLFYETHEEIVKLLDVTKITEAHNYLRTLDKSKYTIDSFIETMKDVALKLNW